MINLEPTLAMTQNFVTLAALPTVWDDTKKDKSFHELLNREVIDRYGLCCFVCLCVYLCCELNAFAFPRTFDSVFGVICQSLTSRMLRQHVKIRSCATDTYVRADIPRLRMLLAE